VTESGETRAEVARRRLAELVAAFEASAPPPDEPTTTPASPVVAPTRRLDPAHVRVLVTIAVAAGVLLTWWLLAERPRTASPDEPVALTSSQPSGRPSASPSAGQVVVDVEGKVKRPGIVTLPVGSRVHDAVAKAGGLTGKVDATGVNMARLLVDGEQILVGLEPVAAASGGAAGASGGKISLGTATLEQLDTLPGIGPVTAQAILDHRSEHGPFRSVDDLLDVKGIGQATLDDLRDQVTP
jgi:competence protein ComEA